MAKAFIYINGELSKKVTEDAESAIDGQEFEFETKNSDLTLDGEFDDPTPYQSGLWALIVEQAKPKLNKVPKPTKITSNITEPGTYNLEVELWDRIAKGKIKIKSPPPSDKSGRKIKKNSHPPHVKVKLAGARAADCPTAHQEELKSLIKLMGKTASYTYVGGSGSSKGWEPDFAGHPSHEQPGEGWKAYIDKESMGTGTKWRLYFEIDFDYETQTLNVDLTKIQQDH